MANREKSRYQKKQGRVKGGGRTRVLITSPIHPDHRIDYGHRLARFFALGEALDRGTIDRSDPRHPEFIFSPFLRRRRTLEWANG